MGMTKAEFLNARRLLNVTQTELAIGLGVDIRTIGRWERGLIEVPKVHAILIRLALIYPDVHKLMELPERRGPNATPVIVTRPDTARS
jgi:transcriptional regulator with XRE-family HTH domain